jgi:hypothetical protein
MESTLIKMRLDGSVRTVSKRVAHIWRDVDVWLLDWTYEDECHKLFDILYGVTWFHKSIDATGKSQDAKFLFKVVSKLVHFTIDSLSMCLIITKVCAFFQDIRKVVDDIGPEHIVHIVTDNGTNYKKACRSVREVYAHIVWTPCLAYTVNLMLKDIGQFDAT